MKCASHAASRAAMMIRITNITPTRLSATEDVIPGNAPKKRQITKSHVNLSRRCPIIRAIARITRIPTTDGIALHGAGVINTVQWVEELCLKKRFEKRSPTFKTKI
jgi:hypothetical protein